MHTRRVDFVLKRLLPEWILVERRDAVAIHSVPDVDDVCWRKLPHHRQEDGFGFKVDELAVGVAVDQTRDERIGQNAPL